MSDRHDRGLLDTSVVVDLPDLSEAALPIHAAIAAVTLAELAAGVHTTKDPTERSLRLMRLQLLESSFDSLPFDAMTARTYGRLVALVVAAGQSVRTRRLELMIAATALVHDLPLYTRNAKDLSALHDAMTVISL